MLTIYVKMAHVFFAILSISFFVTRSVWSIRGSSQLQQGWVRIAPHINDTLLFLCGLYLAAAYRISPLEHSWLAAKLTALILYIVVGSFAIKRAKTPVTKAVNALLAVLIFTYMLGVAIYKNPYVFV